MELTMGEGDNPLSSDSMQLQQKYNRLATEYAKMRAQLGVLKKAVLDEQEKHLATEDRLKEKDQILRKKEAEMDSLTFRNQQMARRVEILQEELDRKPLGKSVVKEPDFLSASESLNCVMSEELQQKIAENAKLHATLDDIDQRYEHRIQVLQSKIGEMETAAVKKAQSERNDDTKLKSLIHGLKVDNADLTVRVKELRKEIVDKDDKITLLKVQLESRSGCVVESRSQPVPPPLTSVDAHVQTVELLSQIGENVQDVVASLSDFHTYWEHRLKDGNGPYNESSGKLSDLLMNNVKFLKPIEQSFQDMLSELLSCGGGGRRFDGRTLLRQLSTFSQPLKNYVRYVVDEVEPLIVVTIRQESNVLACTPTQQAKNSQLIGGVRAFNLVLEKLSGHVAELAAETNDDAKLDVVENVTVAVSQLHQQAGEFYHVYKAKADDEDQHPTTSNQLKNTNQCIVASLASLTSCLNALSHNLSDNLQRIRSLVSADYAPVPVVAAAAVSVEGDKALAADEKTSVVDELRQQVDKLQQEGDGLKKNQKKAEQAKEHWKLEFQLVQMKYDKIKGLEEAGSVVDDCDLSKIYKSRIDHLVTEKMSADSKATHFYLECAGFMKQIKSRERDKLKAEEKLKLAQEEIESLRQDVTTTASNYDDQLNMMTEHVANLNDQLARKTDESERLKYEIQVSRKKL